MKVPIEKFTIFQCTDSQLDEILRVQEEAFAGLSDTNLLRSNTREMLLECLNPPHITIAAWYKGEMAAFSVLYYPQEDEDLSLSLKGICIDGIKAANYKLCIVREKFRGNLLQYTLGKSLEKYAAQDGTKLICATAHPENIFSIRNILKLGYTYNCTFNKYGSVRNLYYKFI